MIYIKSIICEECGAYYELKEGENPENYVDICDCGGKLQIIQNINDKDYRSDSTNTTLKFNPIISIILGIVSWFLIINITQIILPPHTIWTMIMTDISVLCGGFIATYFAKEKKMLYGIYAGVGMISINLFFALIYQFGTFAGLITVYFMTLLFTGIGGFIGEKIGENRY